MLLLCPCCLCDYAAYVPIMPTYHVPAMHIEAKSLHFTYVPRWLCAYDAYMPMVATMPVMTTLP